MLLIQFKNIYCDAMNFHWLIFNFMQFISQFTYPDEILACNFTFVTFVSAYSPWMFTFNSVKVFLEARKLNKPSCLQKEFILDRQMSVDSFQSIQATLSTYSCQPKPFTSMLHSNVLSSCVRPVVKISPRDDDAFKKQKSNPTITLLPRTNIHVSCQNRNQSSRRKCLDAYLYLSELYERVFVHEDECEKWHRGSKRRFLFLLGVCSDSCHDWCKKKALSNKMRFHYDVIASTRCFSAYAVTWKLSRRFQRCRQFSKSAIVQFISLHNASTVVYKFLINNYRGCDGSNKTLITEDCVALTLMEDFFFRQFFGVNEVKSSNQVNNKLIDLKLVQIVTLFALNYQYTRK
ncbi:CLUMA_CG004080, isoform A [Clunio marinus]|uniref:CLUMA_CG004080, isoform A n=1 Tax=Clunio marinus TaxID=568069 RepID=A0A1J1HQI3_9DIPT|nr:CLUMA_CG004080, isoform A [Clunio marinus]